MPVSAPSVERSTSGSRKFYIPTPNVTASFDADSGKMRLHGIASSSMKDRHGDTMTDKALDSMARQAKGMSLYLNHSYVVPEDLAGTVTHAEIRRAADGVNELHYDMDINEHNERAVSTWKAIEGGSKLGLSIGAILVDGGWKRNSDGTFTIDELDLLETSFVAHPANTRAFVEYAIKGLTGWYPQRLLQLEAKHGRDFFLKAAAQANEEVREEDESEPEVGFADPLPKSTAPETMSDALGLPVQTGATPGPETIIGLSASPQGSDVSGPAPTAILSLDLVGALTAAGVPNPERFVPDLAIPDVHPDYEKASSKHLHPHAHVHTETHTHGWEGQDETEHSHQHAHVHSHEHADDHEHADTMDDAQHNHWHNGGYGEDHAHGVEKATDPDVIKATTTIQHPDGTTVWVEHDTDGEPDGDEPKGKTKAADTSQASPEKDPDDGDEALDVIETETGLDDDELLGDTVTKSLAAMSPSIAAALSSNVDLIRALTTENVTLRLAAETARSERDAAVEAAKEVITLAQANADRILQMPMGRRAIIREASDGLVHLRSVYGDSILTSLDRGTPE